MNRRFFLSVAALLFVGCLARAGSYPEKPVEGIVAWAPGGGADILFRSLATVFPKYANGHPLLIKNIAGAAGVPGVIEFMKAPADGYTLIQWNGAQTIKTHMSVTPYTATQFPAVCQIVNDYHYLLVRADETRFKTLADFISFAKANPEEINLGNAGIGGGVHFAQIMFEKAVGIQTTQVPFQGGGPLVAGLISGQVDAASNFIPEGAANVMNGQLRILAVFAPERHPAFPDVPTAREQGVDLVLGQQRGIVASVGTPPARVKEMEEIFRQVARDPEFVRQCKELGSNIAFLPGAEYAKVLEKESGSYLQLIKDNKLGDIYGEKK